MDAARIGSRGMRGVVHGLSLSCRVVSRDSRRRCAPCRVGACTPSSSGVGWGFLPSGRVAVRVAAVPVGVSARGDTRHDDLRIHRYCGDPQRGTGGRLGHRQDHSHRGPAAARRRAQDGRQRRTRLDRQRPRPAREARPAFAQHRRRQLRARRRPHPVARHARRPRIRRAVAARARGRRDRGHRHQRHVRRRLHRAAHDGPRGRAQARPHDHRQPHRRARRRLRRGAGADPRGVRPRVPAAEPAGRARHARRRLLLQPRRARPTSRRPRPRTRRWSSRWWRSTASSSTAT